jgi:hypothetical protein
MILNHETYQPQDAAWPIPADATTANPVGQGSTDMEQHAGGWWIVRRDGYRLAYFCNGPYKTREAAVRSHVDYLDYEKG